MILQQRRELIKKFVIVTVIVATIIIIYRSPSNLIGSCYLAINVVTGAPDV